MGEPDPVEQRRGVVGVVVVRGEQAERLERPDARVHAAGLEHHADAGHDRGVVGDGVEPEHRYAPGGGRR